MCIMCIKVHAAQTDRGSFSCIITWSHFLSFWDIKTTRISLYDKYYDSVKQLSTLTARMRHMRWKEDYTQSAKYVGFNSHVTHTGSESTFIKGSG